ncbi:TIGR04197 family type VII secretion effector [Alkalihalobacterium chitinilyticum]|uniref:TIGR04197 family type VII secretion effector n=1 Tax=Alkalihalobacterium chitinilyticum TaxID=2980103 RepID=A0ABT5VIE8_9BACI|nr:TIGR04197 family type VII secretion effector [Alkalihalobacterium chitinilyticum]MDE5415226.1 TIGR04197 family type VII secretion effector [Alkalihalobacterium chitinilyticum]
MSKEVSINISVFRSSVSKLKTSVARIEAKRPTNAFRNTNIEPFTKDLENAIEAIELLERYKGILEADVTILEQTGEQMREKDQELASVYHPNSGPQLIR